MLYQRIRRTGRYPIARSRRSVRCLLGFALGHVVNSARFVLRGSASVLIQITSLRRPTQNSLTRNTPSRRVPINEIYLLPKSILHEIFLNVVLHRLEFGYLVVLVHHVANELLILMMIDTAPILLPLNIDFLIAHIASEFILLVKTNVWLEIFEL